MYLDDKMHFLILGDSLHRTDTTFHRQTVHCHIRTGFFHVCYVPGDGWATGATEMGRNGCKQMAMVVRERKIPLWFLFRESQGVI